MSNKDYEADHLAALCFVRAIEQLLENPLFNESRAWREFSETILDIKANETEQAFIRPWEAFRPLEDAAAKFGAEQEKLHQQFIERKK